MRLLTTDEISSQRDAKQQLGKSPGIGRSWFVHHAPDVTADFPWPALPPSDVWDIGDDDEEDDIIDDDDDDLDDDDDFFDDDDLDDDEDDLLDDDEEEDD